PREARPAASLVEMHRRDFYSPRVPRAHGGSFAAWRGRRALGARPMGGGGDFPDCAGGWSIAGKMIQWNVEASAAGSRPRGRCRNSIGVERATMAKTKHCLLIVDDEPNVCDSVHDLLRREYRVLKAHSAD